MSGCADCARALSTVYTRLLRHRAESMSIHNCHVACGVTMIDRGPAQDGTELRGTLHYPASHRRVERVLARKSERDMHSHVFSWGRAPRGRRARA